MICQKEQVSLNCPVCKKSSIFSKTTKLLTFPQYLILLSRRFVIDDTGKAIKLMTYVDVPDTNISLDFIKALPKQSGENILGDVDTFAYK